ncbi:hypothetical protein AgCh_022484 [Apium graveolens]
MTGDKALLSQFGEMAGPLVTFGDNSKGFTMGYGKIVYGNVVIEDVALVVGLEVNLLSVSQFADRVKKDMDDSEVPQSKVRVKVPIGLNRASRSFMRYRDSQITTAMADFDFPVLFDHLELSVRGSLSSLRLELHLVPPPVLTTLPSVITAALLQAILR